MNPKITHVIDCGRNTAVVYSVDCDGEECAETITHEQLLNLPFTLPAGSFVVGEAAHLAVPRTRKSRAQVFIDKQLSKFYKDCEDNNIRLRFCPQDLAPRARQVALESGIINASGKLTDLDDCKAIAYFYNTNDKLRGSLQIPPKSFEKTPRRNDGESFKDDVNFHLNFFRSGKDDEKDTVLMNLINENKELLFDSLSSDSREILRLKRGKKGVTKTSLKDGLTTIYTIGATIYDVDGNVMTRYENKIPGWGFVKRFVLSSSPNHRRGGVARSNLWFHAFRNYVIRATGTGSLTKKTYKPNDPEINFARTFKMDVKGDVKDVRIKRGHFNAKEDKKFLELRGKFNKCQQELWTFFVGLAIKNGKGKYSLLGEQNVSFMCSQTKLFD